MTVSFKLRDMTVAELETLLSLMDPIDQARAYSEITKRIETIKASEIDHESD